MAYLKIEDIESSYCKNDLGKTLYETVLTIAPEKIVEFGILHGYSTVAMAQAVRDLGRGRIIAYDLFDDYRYNHSTKKEVIKNLKKYKLSKFATVKKLDFFKWIKKPDFFDILHLDISNDGEIIETAVNGLQSFLKRGAVIIFEGGVRERDKVDWMIKYKKTPMYPLKQKLGYEILNEEFTGLSIIKRSLPYAK